MMNFIGGSAEDDAPATISEVTSTEDDASKVIDSTSHHWIRILKTVLGVYSVRYCHWCCSVNPHCICTRLCCFPEFCYRTLQLVRRSLYCISTTCVEPKLPRSWKVASTSKVLRPGTPESQQELAKCRIHDECRRGYEFGDAYHNQVQIDGNKCYGKQNLSFSSENNSLPKLAILKSTYDHITQASGLAYLMWYV